SPSPSGPPDRRSRETVVGTPDSRWRGASLFRATPRVKFRRASSSFVSQPEGGRQFESDPAGTSRRYGGPQRLRQLNQAVRARSRLLVYDRVGYRFRVSRWCSACQRISELSAALAQ